MTDLQGWLRAAHGRRICVVGDVLLDEFLWGRADRLAPDAPVPVVRSERTTYRASGAALAGQAAACLGARVDLVSLTGADDRADRVADIVRGYGLCVHLVSDPTRPTPLKTRVFAGRQQVVRIDSETTTPPGAGVARELASACVSAAALADSVVISDYAKGVCSQELVRLVMETARERRVPVVVDPKRRLPRHYAGATLLTPNLGELEALAAYLGLSGESPESAARALSTATGAEWVLATMGARGMLLVGRAETHHVSARRTAVVDESGGGDAVAGTMAVALAAGVSPLDGAGLASLVASLCVGRTEDKAFTCAELLAASGQE
jgi:D-beta-D-heptose 7-phosphate kinase / D-beta-D-heptose 1-phosphate adenosyltransferase